MPDLEDTLYRHFGTPDARGNRMVALGASHVLHEAGFEVSYSRYSVTYHDAVDTVDMAAEIDEDGVLHIRSDGVDERTLRRVHRALAFMQVSSVFEKTS